MLIFLYGQDAYRSRQKLNEIIEHYQKIHKSGINLRYFDNENSTPEAISDEIQQASLFQEKKLIILKNIFSNQKEKERYLDIFKKVKNSKDLILIYEEKEINQDNSLFKLLKKIGKTQEFNFLNNGQLQKWVVQEFAKFGAEITPPALEKLIQFVGNDLWQLSNEIEKLVNFKQDGRIIPEDVELLVKPLVETDIFKTIDAIALQNKKRALFLLHKHLEKGDSPLYLLSMINFQFRNLLIVKELLEKNIPYYSISKTTRLHPFVVKKSYQQAAKFNFQELKKIYQKIFQTDLDIKTGKREPETALDLLITEL